MYLSGKVMIILKCALILPYATVKNLNRIDELM